jgi:hypothetical protein
MSRIEKILLELVNERVLTLGEGYNVLVAVRVLAGEVSVAECGGVWVSGAKIMLEDVK